MRTRLLALSLFVVVLGMGSGFAPASEGAPSLLSLPLGTATPVLLVTDASLVPAWGRFAHWKTQQGKATRVLTVQEIDKRYEGADLQAKIRVCVLEHIEKHGTRWVVLGGDSQPDGKGLVPDRDTPHVVSSRLKYPDIPTDLYYISTGDWDANARAARCATHFAGSRTSA